MLARVDHILPNLVSKRDASQQKRSVLGIQYLLTCHVDETSWLQVFAWEGYGWRRCWRSGWRSGRDALARAKTPSEQIGNKGGRRTHGAADNTTSHAVRFIRRARRECRHSICCSLGRGAQDDAPVSFRCEQSLVVMNLKWLALTVPLIADPSGIGRDCPSPLE